MTVDAVGSQDVRLRAVVESSPSGLLMIDSAGTLVLVNQQIERMFGYAREELLGQPIDMLVPPRFRDAHPSYRQDYFSQPRVRAMGAGRDLYGLRKDRTEVPVEIGLTPIVTTEGVFVISSIVDITERKKAEDDRAQLEDRLRHAHKMEAVGTMAGRVAHDFNNILATIIGCAEVLEPNLASEEACRDLGALLAAAERGRDIVQRILTFSRPDRSVRPVELAQLVDEGIKLLRVTLPSGVKIERLPAPELPRVLAQPTAVHQVLMNLATNAAHAMPEGGLISIDLDERDSNGAQRLESGTLNAGTYVRMRVRDTGHGIAPERLSLVFEPFVSDRPSGAGSGLGLAIVRDILRDHGGSVWIESEPGVGTTVSCWFPAEYQATAAPPQENPPLQRGGGERILLVDDEDALRSTLARLLESIGYDVETCSDGPSALQRIEACPVPFDLVLTDQTMPSMSGRELIRSLRERGSSQRVALLTGHLDDVTPSELSELGVVAVGTKPLRRAELAALVRNALDRDGLVG